MTAPQVVLGFDYGTVRIGVASGNTLTQTAQPLTTLASKPALWDDIERLVKDYSPNRFVVGLPYNMDGTDTRLTAAVREFATQLSRRFAVPVTLIDERLSSAAAEQELRDARMHGERKKRVTRSDVDQTAAKVLVEQWLRQHAR